MGGNSTVKKALIIGITGQDGSYLAEYLQVLGYTVWGSTHRFLHRGSLLDKNNCIYLDLRDQASVNNAIMVTDPDEIYNLGAQSFVPPSWHDPAATFDINASGLARILSFVEAYNKKIKIYQASSSEMFGNVDGVSNEDTVMNPTSPYGVAKLAAHKLCDVYRQKGVFAVSGICFNHESPRRGHEMVTRKITAHIGRCAASGILVPIRLGSTDTYRDWGFAGDYVVAMHKMLQLTQPEDFVISTGEAHSVQRFFDLACEAVGIRIPIEVDARFLRKGEIKIHRGDSSKAFKTFGWRPSCSFEQLVLSMVENDVRLARRDLKRGVQDAIAQPTIVKS